VPETSEVTEPADLAGLRIGLPLRAGETWFGLQALLAEAGLTEEDVEIVEIGYTQQAALTTGQVDAVVGFRNNDQVQFELADIPTRVVPLTDSGVVPLVSIVLATTRENLDENPEVAQKVASAMVAGISATVDAPASAIEVSRAYIPTLSEPGAEAAAAATLEATVPLWGTAGGDISGTMRESEWSDMTTFMYERGLLATQVAPYEAMQNVITSS
ncbi:MAG: ABC transporter substrate-binding protein, partial [Propioniciclava sp.]